MKTITTAILLCAGSLAAQSLDLNQSGTFSDTRSRTPMPTEQLTYAADLPMYTLLPAVTTNTSSAYASLNITVHHPRRIAQRPDVLVARYHPPLIQELFKLRQQYVGIMNQVAYDTADARIEGTPRRIDMGYGRGYSNVIRKSARDKANIEHRAEMTAINYLERVTRAHYKIRANSMTGSDTYHFNLPPGQYALCIMQRVKDNDPKAGLGSKTALWWSTFTIEENTKKEMILDESNAITWREIFAVEKK
ncbi:MAG: hypothetical protein PHO37_14435 [Kiritimatiellae bacterium]|nr:hypothetical protein [Kiritimatiellia bacterium]